MFGPDRTFGTILSRNSIESLFSGQALARFIFSLMRKNSHRLTLEHPKAVVIAHPECEQSVLNFAHVIGSTSRLLEEVQKNPAKEFIVATEAGIFHQMKKLRPDVTLIQAPVQDKSYRL